MDKILEGAEALNKLSQSFSPEKRANGEEAAADTSSSSDEALPQLLARANDTKNQINRFLATAIWLHSKGLTQVKTSDITKALKDAHQNRLSNPSQCLAKNAKKGFCVKDGRSFYVTDEGREHLGLK